MANKRTSNSSKTTKKSTSSSAEGRVTRITASDKSDSKKRVKATPAKKQKTDIVAKPKRKLSLRRKKSAKTTKVNAAADMMAAEPTKNPFRALGRYFKGAWYELNQVRWPDRPTTWQMTEALLAFTAFFVLVIVLLDSLFKYLFEFILG